MIKKKLLIALLVICNHFLLFSQCEYNLNNYSHNDCYGLNEGAIDISLINPNSNANWQGPNGFTSSSLSLTNLYAGTYYLTITNSILSCNLLDSIEIKESIQLSANFSLSGRCINSDSVDVIASLWGGTPPYTTLWSNGDTSRNIYSLPPLFSAPYILTITDENSCQDTVHLWINEVNEMIPFMSSVSTICKDDYSGEARIFVQGGTSPFNFNWINQNIFITHDSLSSISNLTPGFYSVEINDDMGCVIIDSIEVKSNPKICLNIYKAFSPNDDDVNEFWEIENIELYPNAIVLVYDRNGNEVYRRRNYFNAEEVAFGGKDKNNQPRPSGTYYYIIDLENEDDVFKGTVTIVR